MINPVSKLFSEGGSRVQVDMRVRARAEEKVENRIGFSNRKQRCRELGACVQIRMGTHP